MSPAALMHGPKRSILMFHVIESSSVLDGLGGFEEEDEDE
jgi:hypothetical protein